MRFRLQNWLFQVDMEATMAHSAAEVLDHCTCDYCVNYYKGVDVAYPHIRPFLAQFGLDAEAPEHLMCYGVGEYAAVYWVQGVILQSGEPVEVDGLRICFEPADEGGFEISMDFDDIRWTMNTPFKDVISPANLPENLEFAEKWRLSRMEDTQMQ